MGRIFAIHEYELRHDTDSQEFESVLKNTLLSKELDMPGLESRHLLKGYKVKEKACIRFSGYSKAKRHKNNCLESKKSLSKVLLIL